MDCQRHCPTEVTCQWYLPKDCHLSSGCLLDVSHGCSEAFSDECSCLWRLVCTTLPWPRYIQSYISKGIWRQGIGPGVGNPCVSTPCPVVKCPYLCISDTCGPTRWTRSPRPGTANLPTNIVGFRGSDSSIVLIIRGEIPRSIGDSPESLRQAILVGCNVTPSPPTKSFPTKSPRVKISGRLPIILHGHENSHPLESRVCLSQTLRNQNY